MRTAIDRKKLGMTRIFNEDGKHVACYGSARWIMCQVVAQRTAEKDGYTAVQLAWARARRRRRTCQSRCAATMPRQRSSRKEAAPSFA